MKKSTIMLLAALTAAVGLFAGYLLWIHKQLDTVGPVITVPQELLEISVTDPEEALLQGLTAYDAVDGDVTDSLLVESVYGISGDNLTTVTYAAFDKAGNVSKIQRQVRYVDYESPRLELYGSLTFVAGSGFDVLDYVGATDVLEGDIRRRVHATLVSDTNSVNEVGSHEVRFQVINSLGDTVEVVLPVDVYDSDWFSASVELKEYLIYLEVGESLDPEDYLESFVVRGEPIDISRRIPEDVTCTITNRLNSNVPGVYEITYTLSKNLNLTTYSGQAKLIVIVEE